MTHPEGAGESIARRPLLVLAGSLGLGAVLGGELGRHEAAWLLAGATVLLALAPFSRRLAFLALAAAALSLGTAAAAVEADIARGNPLAAWVARQGDAGEPVRVEGLAAEDLPADTGNPVLAVDVEAVARGNERHAVKGRLRLRIGGTTALPEIGRGERIAAWVVFGAVPSYRNRNEPDREEELRRTGVSAVGTCKSSLLIEAGAASGNGIVRWAAASRRWARAVLRAHVASGPEQALVRAMVLGDRTSLDAETAEAFRIAGTYHVLAISGAQVALLAGVLLGAARLFRLGPGWAAAAISGSLVFYAAFVGGQPPVARAVIMAVVLLAGRALDLDSDLANLLGLAAGLLLVLHPAAVWDVSFQLSFAATLGLLLLGSVVQGWLPPMPWGLRPALAASVGAQAALLPLLATRFHRLAPAALVLNLVAVPLSAAVLLTGFGLLGTAGLLPGLAPWVGSAAWYSARALLVSGEVVRNLPALDVRVPTPTASASLFYVATFLLLADARCRRRAAPLAALALVNLVWGRAPFPGDGRFHVIMLDVGQGDCFLLRSPSGRVSLVDTGGSSGDGFDFGERVLGPILWEQGIRALDRLVLTHGHPDHVGAAPFLVRAFHVGETWEGPAPRADPYWAGIDAALRTSGVARRTVFEGSELLWEGVRLRVLAPARAIRAPWRTRNDDSLVLLAEFGRVRFLLTGDIEAHAEAGLAPPAVTVLKVPHHGSRSSSTPVLLARASPRTALLSVGRRNRFGHPHADVVDRYRTAGIRLLRTDRDGAVDLATDGEGVFVECVAGGCEARVR